MTDNLKQKNRKLVRTLLLVTVGMFGFGYALVPLYDVLCKVTGLNGKVDKLPAQAVSFQPDNSRELTVEFLTTVNASAPITFRAETKQITVHPGQAATVYFYAENNTDKAMVARAIPSISPGEVAEFFKKTECFCFSEQQFLPRESKKMPVRFVINPDIPAQHKTVTLAYTFFDNTERSDKK